MRFRDWQTRFQRLLVERRSAPFAWGTNDCATFAADGVLATTGVDFADGLRDHADARQAAERMESVGGLEGAVTSKLGESISPALAQVGDVGLCTINGRDSLALCGGDHWVGPGETGLVSVPMETAVMAWRV